MMEGVMSNLIASLQGFVNRYPITWYDWITVSAAICIVACRLIRTRHECAGNGFIKHYGRLAVRLLTFVSSVYLVYFLGHAGQGFMAQNDINFHRSQRERFDTLFITGVPSEARQNSAIDPERSAGMIFPSGLLWWGDVFLELWGLLLLAGIRLTVPIIAACAFVRTLEQDHIFRYCWGVSVLALIWPALSHYIRGLAYWCSAMLIEIADSVSGSDFLVASYIGIIGVSLVFFVPPIAYQLAAGRLYKAVSNTICAWRCALTRSRAENPV
jgi:hypothetical protein